MNQAESQIDPLINRKRGRPPRNIGGILEAAITVFAREGYSAATIEMIAAEASASTATLYKRFTNKKGLFVAVLEEIGARTLAIHLENRLDREHAFSPIIGRLTAHGVVGCDPGVRGIMRAWMGEVRPQGELAELFAVTTGQELIIGVTKQLKKLQEQGLIDMAGEHPKTFNFAANMMIGIVERFTMTRGLVLGDLVEPTFSPKIIAEQAVHAVMGKWGTPRGIAAFNAISKSALE
jgi:AcrR family transcriptional regulator